MAQMKGVNCWDGQNFNPIVNLFGLPLWLSWYPPAMWKTCIRSLGWEDPLEKGTATHSGILAWRIPWTVWSDRTE